ncbi:MAG: glycosyltransferase family 4 protein [Planctomycetes bacterium]|nr:glycosyltransferase family 4 protein [Planctomycetota bacterium]
MLRKLKIVCVSDIYHPGLTRAFFDPARELARRGHEVHFLSAVNETGPKTGETIDGVRFHTFVALPGTVTTGGGYSYFRLLRRSYREFARTLESGVDPDLWLHNGPHSASSIARVRSACRKPWLYVFHSPWQAEHAARAGRSGTKLRRFLSLSLGGKFRNHLESVGLSKSERIVTLSEYMRGMLAQYHPEVPAGRCTKIGGWVDLEKFGIEVPKKEARRKLGLDESGRIILTIRRIEPRMGIDLLLGAFENLASDFPDARLLIGGNGPSRTELEDRARKSSANDRINFLGFVDETDLPLLYRAADLFVLPTRELEGFGLVTVEALASGTPAIGTKLGGTVEVLSGLGEEFLIEAPKVEAVESKIREMLAGQCSTPGIDRQMREYAESNFRLSAVVDRMENLIDEITASPRR